jgi:hypothetical protein
MPAGAILYHTGFLMRDRLFDREANTKAHKMARRYERGEVHLVQKRVTYGVFEYFAVPVSGGSVLCSSIS